MQSIQKLVLFFRIHLVYSNWNIHPGKFSIKIISWRQLTGSEECLFYTFYPCEIRFPHQTALVAFISLNHKCENSCCFNFTSNQQIFIASVPMWTSLASASKTQQTSSLNIALLYFYIAILWIAVLFGVSFVSHRFYRCVIDVAIFANIVSNHVSPSFIK